MEYRSFNSIQFKPKTQMLLLIMESELNLMLSAKEFKRKMSIHWIQRCSKKAHGGKRLIFIGFRLTRNNPNRFDEKKKICKWYMLYSHINIQRHSDHSSIKHFCRFQCPLKICFFSNWSKCDSIRFQTTFRFELNSMQKLETFYDRSV